jgi:hypothetical protein
VITTGYLNGPSTASNAQAVQADPTTGVQRASIVLGEMYWIVGIPHVRDSFANGTLPYSCPAGTCLQVPHYEAAALVAAGAASWC